MTRADLEAELMDLGFSERKARQVVREIFSAIREALERGEKVELPIGTFEVLEHKRQPFRTWALNRIRVTYKKRRKFIRFSGELNE